MSSLDKPISPLRLRFLMGSVCIVVILIAWPRLSLGNPVSDFPLQPPDTSSPRATMDSFLNNMIAAHKQYLHYQKTYFEDPGWYHTKPVRAELGKALLFLTRATRCLDLSQVPPSLQKRLGFESTLLLKTIFDRISLPPLDSIPDAEEMILEDLSQWRVPNTDITIAKVFDGPHEGEYLFSPSTVDRLDEYYELVKPLPHKPGGWQGVYTLYTEVSGDIIPDKLVYKLPAWAKTRVFRHPLWKWCMAIFALLLAVYLLYKIFHFIRGRPGLTPLQAVLYRIIFPISLMVLGFSLDYLQFQIGFVGGIRQVLTKGLMAVTFFGASWTLILIGNIIAEGVISYPSITEKGLDAAMIRVVARIITFAVAAWVVVVGAQVIGIPLAPVLAGLGVGGLALALSAQPTVENFIGGMTLFADRPVRLGELVKFGDKFGEVEEIGVRSTRIRTLDRTLVTVPNAEFSKLHLENYSKRDMMWFHPRISLRLDTTPDQLRYILIEIRKILFSHPKVHQDPARIRFVEYGEYSLDLDVFAYIPVSDYGEYLEVAEDLYLRMIEVINQSGTGFAVPAHREYVEEMSPMDERRVREIEAEVEAWRESNSLFLPNFPEEKIRDLEGTLEYPPQGSPSKETERET